MISGLLALWYEYQYSEPIVGFIPGESAHPLPLPFTLENGGHLFTMSDIRATCVIDREKFDVPESPPVIIMGRIFAYAQATVDRLDSGNSVPVFCGIRSALNVESQNEAGAWEAANLRFVVAHVEVAYTTGLGSAGIRRTYRSQHFTWQRLGRSYRWLKGDLSSAQGVLAL